MWRYAERPGWSSTIWRHEHQIASGSRASDGLLEVGAQGNLHGHAHGLGDHPLRPPHAESLRPDDARPAECVLLITLGPHPLVLLLWIEAHLREHPPHVHGPGPLGKPDEQVGVHRELESFVQAADLLVQVAAPEA